MVSIVRFFVIVVVFCLTSDHLIAQEKKSVELEIKTALTDKGKRDRLRQIYNRFWKERQIPIKCSYLVLNNLTRAGNSLESAEAFDCVNSFLAATQRNKKLENLYADAVRKELGSSYEHKFLTYAQSWNTSLATCEVASITH